MKFITFSGVDGSGKSTQLARLKAMLEQTGKKVAYFHAVEFSLAARFKKQTTGETPAKAVTQASWPAIILRKVFLVVDLFRFRSYIAKLHEEGYDYLVSDRYFYDTIVNIEYLSKKRCRLPVVAFQLIVKPDIAFYFDLAPETIMSRERVPEQGIKYLKDKMRLFQNWIAPWEMVVIDASRDPESITQDILKELNDQGSSEKS